MIELEYLNLKIYLLKDILLTGVKKYLLLINDTVPWTYSLKDLNGEEIIGSFCKENCKRLNYNIFIK